MWANSELKAEVTVLRAEVAQLRLDLEREKSARLADRLDALGKMETIRENLAGAVSGLRGKTPPVKVAGSIREFRDFAESGEGINVS